MKQTGIPSFFIIILFIIITACSDAGTDKATVNINFGLSKAGTKAPAVDDVTGISLTVTGAGMDAINKTIDLSTGTIQLKVPAGPAREFTVIANTPMSAPASFRGRETADLPKGETVDLFINMDPLYRSEGSIAAPIFIQANTAEHEGTVSKEKSYYSTQSTDDFLSISVTGLTDDADLIIYGDAGFNSIAYSSDNGRTMREDYGTSSPDPVYFVIDGKYTGVNSEGEGATYKIKIVSYGMGEVTTYNEGLSNDPLQIEINESTGFLSDRVIDSGSYYVTSIIPGSTYCVNVYDPQLTASLFSDQFVTQISNPFSNNINTLYIHVTGSSAFYKMDLVTNEGSALDPICLFPEKANYCQVGTGSSYYIFEGTAGVPYVVRTNYQNNSVEFSVYNNAAFTSLAGNSTSYTGYSQLNFTPASSVITVRVDDVTGNGAAFDIIVFKNR